jgi:hypothetical protein
MLWIITKYLLTAAIVAVYQVALSRTLPSSPRRQIGMRQFGMIALKPGIRISKARCTSQPVARAMISIEPQRNSIT